MQRNRGGRIRRAGTAVGVALALAACGGGGSDNGSNGSGGGVLRMPYEVGSGGAETMDPYDGNRFWPAINMVFDRLIGFDKDFNPIPELATGWEPNADLTEWTLTLRDDVKFHDGSVFDSADVVYSVNRMIDPEFDSPVRAVLGIISGAEALDATTVKLTLSAAEADMPVLLADYRALMTPEGSAETVGATPVGTGPFKLATLDPEGTTVLEANPEYFLGAPKLSRIELVGIPDADAAAQALLGGQVNFMLSTDSKGSAMFADEGKFTVQKIPSGDWNAIDFRVDQPPFDDPRVLKALRIAADRQELTDLVLGPNGGVVACDTPVWTGDPYRWDGDCPQDIDGAKALLAEAGFPDGIDIEIFTSDVEDHMVELAEVYQQQVKDAGIRVTVTSTDASGYWDDVWLKEPAYVDSWGQRPTTQVLNEVFRSDATWNPTGQADPELDAMLDEARSILDPEQRTEAYQNIQEYLFEHSATFIPYHKSLVRVMAANVKGVQPVVVDAVRWEQISVE